MAKKTTFMNSPYENAAISLYEEVLREGKKRVIPMRLMGKIFGVSVEAISRDYERIDDGLVTPRIALSRFSSFTERRGDLQKDPTISRAYVRNFLGVIDRAEQKLQSEARVIPPPLPKKRERTSP